MRILLHGFGSYPVVFWHLIRHSQSCNHEHEWAIILTSDHYKSLFIKLLGSDRVIVLTQTAGTPEPGEDNWTYPGAFFRDLASEKRNYKSDDAMVQSHRGMEMYRQTRRLVETFQPTHALVSQVEGFDGKSFIAAAREYGSQVIVPTSLRNLGGVFFAPDDLETLPSYAFQGHEQYHKQAKQFILDFREKPKSAWNPIPPQGELLDSFLPPLAVRMRQTLRRWFFTPNGFQLDFLRVSLLNNLPGIRDWIWAQRTRRNAKNYDIKSLDELPEGFIYYPLQYSPESSINTPAPYFVDQMRAIDAIRFSMPSNCTLVVKEHPSCISVRSGQLVRQLQRTAGVLVAHFRMPSTEISKRAGLTLSVTGTSTFESMLQGKQALCLGAAFFSKFLGGITPLEDLSERIKQLFGQEYPMDESVNSVAAGMNVGYQINFTCPGTPGEPVLRKENIARVYDAFLDHCRREEKNRSINRS